MPCSPDQPEIQTPESTRGSKPAPTGAGIALPTEDADEVGRRFEALEAEMRPKSELARQLVVRVALLTLRLDRSAEHEAKAIAYRMRRAAADFDEARLAEVDQLISWIASEPATNARRLRRMPEGIDRLIAAIEGLRADLARPGGYRWGFEHCDRFLHLTGRRYTDLPVHRARALTDAIAGNFQFLDPTEGEGLEINDRRVWAIGQLVALLDAEVVALKQLREGMDLEGLELDRAEAASRAIFDPSKEAILARKYEAATERGMYRALREFRETDPTAEVVSKQRVAEELGSSLPGPSADDEGSVIVDPIEVADGRGAADDHQAGLGDELGFTSGGRPGPGRAPGRAVRGG